MATIRLITLHLPSFCSWLFSMIIIASRSNTWKGTTHKPCTPNPRWNTTKNIKNNNFKQIIATFAEFQHSQLKTPKTSQPKVSQKSAKSQPKVRWLFKHEKHVHAEFFPKTNLVSGPPAKARQKSAKSQPKLTLKNQKKTTVSWKNKSNLTKPKITWKIKIKTKNKNHMKEKQKHIQKQILRWKTK